MTDPVPRTPRPGESPAQTHPRIFRLSRHAAFIAVGYGLWIVLLGGTIPTPLYPVYEQDFHFSPTTITVIFAVYAVGVLAGLILCARASDTIGRRPIILIGMAVAALSSVVFIVSTGVETLLVGRVLSGLSVGLVTSTATAALTEIEPTASRERASGVAATINLVGLASGPLLAGALAQYAPSPTVLVFLVDIALLVPAALVILWAPETAPGLGRRAGWRLPRFSLPQELRPVFVRASMAALAGFAVVGLFSALAGALVVSTLAVTNLAVVGVAVFLLFATAALAQLLWARARWWSPMSSGLIALFFGIALNLAALLEGSPLAFWSGIVVSGFGFGLSFLGSLRLLNDEVPAERRGELLGEYFLVAYVGLSVPVVGVGILTDAFGLRSAAEIFTVFVGILLVLGLVLVSGRSRSESAP